MNASDAHKPATTSLLYSVKRLELLIRARLDDLLRGSGVTTLQYTALTVLARHDGISAAQLARDSFVTPQAMADMLKALEARDLVSRSRNPRSKREILVHLSPAGRDFLARYADPVEALEQRMLSDFTAHQCETFRRAIGTARTALEREAD